MTRRSAASSLVEASRIEASELSPGVLGGESPIDRQSFSVAYVYRCRISSARPESPWRPPARPLARLSIAVAGPNAPCSIAPCRRTSPPGSNSPSTVGRALPVRRMSSGSSAAISNAAFSRMALRALDAPTAATIFSSPGRARVVALSRLQHPADGRNRRPSGRPRFSAVAGPPVGAVRSQAPA